MKYKVITGTCFVESTQTFYYMGGVLSDTDAEPEEIKNLLSRCCVDPMTEDIEDKPVKNNKK